MVITDNDYFKKIEIVEQSSAFSYGSVHTFTNQEVLGIIDWYKKNTFKCPLCGKIIFPEVAINDDQELYCAYDECVALNTTPESMDFLPKKTCVGCKSKYQKMISNMNSILQTINEEKEKYL